MQGGFCLCRWHTINGGTRARGEVGPGKVKNGTAALIPRQPRRHWGRGQGETSCSLAVSAGGTASPLWTREWDKQASRDRPGDLTREDGGSTLGTQSPSNPSMATVLLSPPGPCTVASETPSTSRHQGGLFPHTGTHSGGHHCSLGHEGCRGREQEKTSET